VGTSFTETPGSIESILHRVDYLADAPGALHGRSFFVAMSRNLVR